MTFTERRQRVIDTAGVLVLLELSAASFSESVRLVNDTRNWVSGGHTYIGFPFRFTLPDDTRGAASRAVLEIDNIGREITADLEALQPGDVVTGTLRITDREDPDDIELEMPIPMTGVVANQAVIIAQLGYDPKMHEQAVRVRYTPFVAPGIF